MKGTKLFPQARAWCPPPDPQAVPASASGVPCHPSRTYERAMLSQCGWNAAAVAVTITRPLPALALGAHCLLASRRMQCGFSNTCVQILNLMECPSER